MKKFVYIITIIIIIAIIFIWQIKKSQAKTPVVVIYVSEDQVFSEPVLNTFERITGIKVKAIYDTEESKSTGAMNRLIAEKNNPQADVYWANEPIRAEALKQLGISTPYFSTNAIGIPKNFKDLQGYWTGFSARARVLIVNKKITDAPKSILAYTQPKWKGKAVIANPLFGTTTTQIAALFSVWGDKYTKNFLQEIKNNKIKISSSNGESADLVASGEFDFSLVDSDDAINRIRQNKPIKMIYPDQGKDEIGCLIVPNAAVLIKSAPHPDNAKKLIDFLLSKRTEKQLAFADCAQIPLHSGVDTPAELKQISQLKTMKINYSKVAKKLQEIQPFLKKWMDYK